MNEDGGRQPSASPSSWWTRRPRGTWLPATDRSSTPRSRAGPSRCVVGWRVRPETFAACGFSDLRGGFVPRDESGRRQRPRAPRGSGHADREHDAGSSARGTRPSPLAILRSTNCARSSEEPGASRAGRAGVRRGGGGREAARAAAGPPRRRKNRTRRAAAHMRVGGPRAGPPARHAVTVPGRPTRAAPTLHASPGTNPRHAGPGVHPRHPSRRPRRPSPPPGPVSRTLR